MRRLQPRILIAVAFTVVAVAIAVVLALRDSGGGGGQPSTTTVVDTTTTTTAVETTTTSIEIPDDWYPKGSSRYSDRQPGSTSSSVSSVPTSDASDETNGVD